ncbi:Stc1 domain-containing protein [Aspergillus unguis]
MGNRRVTPASAVPNAFAGGYSEKIKRQLENVQLPDKIKCKTCKKLRSAHAYSNRQLDYFRNAFVVQGQRALAGGHANCRDCTGQQTMELNCCICHKTKGLDEFALNQRKEHENARCLSCVQSHRDAEPFVDQDRMITGADLSTIQGTITSHIGSSMASTKFLSSSDAAGHHSSAAGATTDSGPIGGGIWVEPERHEANSSKGQALNNLTTTYGSEIHGNPAAIQGKSVHSGWASLGIHRSEAARSVCSDQERKFAKIKAYRPEVPKEAPSEAPEVQATIDYSDDEDEEEDPNDFL